MLCNRCSELNPYHVNVPPCSRLQYMVAGQSGRSGVLVTYPVMEVRRRDSDHVILHNLRLEVVHVSGLNRIQGTVIWNPAQVGLVTHQCWTQSTHRIALSHYALNSDYTRRPVLLFCETTKLSEKYCKHPEFTLAGKFVASS